MRFWQARFFIAASVLLTDCGSIFKKHLKEGVIEYAVSYPTLGDDKFALSSLPDKAIVKFKNGKCMTELSALKGMVTMTFICEPDNKKLLQGFKFLTDKVYSELNEKTKDKWNSNYLKEIKSTKETKKIANYNCKKVIATLVSGETVDVYYTTDINIKDANWNNPYKEIDGVLMEFEMERYGITMKLIATSVSVEDVSDSSFELSSDYKKVPFSQLERTIQSLSPVQ